MDNVVRLRQSKLQTDSTIELLQSIVEPSNRRSSRIGSCPRIAPLFTHHTHRVGVMMNTSRSYLHATVPEESELFSQHSYLLQVVI